MNLGYEFGCNHHENASAWCSVCTPQSSIDRQKAVNQALSNIMQKLDILQDNVKYIERLMAMRFEEELYIENKLDS